MSENAITSNPFKLISTRAVEVTLVGKGTSFSNDYILDFNHTIFGIDDPKTEEDRRIFIVEFVAKISNSTQSLTFSTTFHVVFQCEYPITKAYLESPVIRINTPAIAFPFLRSFITTVSANAGYPPIILPSINFVRLTAKQVNEEGKDS